MKKLLFTLLLTIFVLPVVAHGADFALQFNGEYSGSNNALANISTHNIGTDFTVETRLKLFDDIDFNLESLQFFLGTHTGDNFGDTYINAYVNDGVIISWEDPTGYFLPVISNDFIPYNTETHVAFRSKNDIFSIFINGVEQNDTEARGTRIFNNSLTISTTDDFISGFNGIIDEFRMYDTGLTDQQILDHSNKNYSDVGAVSIFHFNEGEGNIIEDSIGGFSGYTDASWTEGFGGLFAVAGLRFFTDESLESTPTQLGASVSASTFSLFPVMLLSIGVFVAFYVIQQLMFIWGIPVTKTSRRGRRKKDDYDV